MRCLAAEPPGESPEVTLGELKLQREGRVLRISGAPDSVRVAAFSGPGLASAPTAAAVAKLQERNPTVALMLGGLGDDDTTVSDTLAALSEVSFPVLFVPGGRDSWARLQALLETQPEAMKRRFFDLSTTSLVRIGGHELVPVPGSADGRYAVAADGCGYAVSDLQARARELPEPEGPRYLVAWQAPGRGDALAVGRSEGGLDIGSDALAEMAARVAAPGGIFAWPADRIDRPVVGGGAEVAAPGTAAPDLRVVVPRLTGPAQVAAGGHRVPAGFLMLALEPEGLRYLGRVEASGVAVADVSAAEPQP